MVNYVLLYHVFHIGKYATDQRFLDAEATQNSFCSICPTKCSIPVYLFS